MVENAQVANDVVVIEEPKTAVDLQVGGPTWMPPAVGLGNDVVCWSRQLGRPARVPPVVGLRGVRELSHLGRSAGMYPVAQLQ
ncbi:hypothetical protein TIFTF001_044213 [Ficus carica]|uniref:Uncharacterized protein n=1 Tax=Ficus carica TaxID=3494 RepID=A0AA87ZB56_FICCA|nr:hypothetical protein TIFTF001_044213 [Ficus carica]